jgi:hypothetical protein
LIVLIILSKEYKLWSSSLCSFSPAFCHFIPLWSKYSSQHRVLKHPHVRDQVAPPYKTTGKIIILYFLIFMFLDSRREDKSFWTELW